MARLFFIGPAHAREYIIELLRKNFELNTAMARPATYIICIISNDTDGRQARTIARMANHKKTQFT